jgi:hypothetical protein
VQDASLGSFLKIFIIPFFGLVVGGGCFMIIYLLLMIISWPFKLDFKRFDKWFIGFSIICTIPIILLSYFYYIKSRDKYALPQLWVKTISSSLSCGETFPPSHSLLNEQNISIKGKVAIILYDKDSNSVEAMVSNSLEKKELMATSIEQVNNIVYLTKETTTYKTGYMVRVPVSGVSQPFELYTPKLYACIYDVKDKNIIAGPVIFQGGYYVSHPDAVGSILDKIPEPLKIAPNAEDKTKVLENLYNRVEKWLEELQA